MAGGTVITTRRSVRTSPGTAAGRTRLRRNLSPPAALRTGPVDREPALAERDRPPAVALGAGGPGRARRAAAARAGGAGLRHRDRDRDLPAERGDPERHLDHAPRASRLGVLLAPAPAEDRREDVAQSAEVAELESLAGVRRASAPRARPAPARDAPGRCRGPSHRTRPAAASGRTASASPHPTDAHAPRRSP